MTRRFSVFGDSISSFHGSMPEGWRVFYESPYTEQTGVLSPEDTWWGQVIKHFEGEFFTNAAWSGCVVEGTEFPVGASAKRIAALKKDGESPDDILVFIGINDYGWGCGEAQIAAATPSAPPALAAACPRHGEIAGMAPAGAELKFAESYARMLQQMKEQNPQANIWCGTLLPGRVQGNALPTFPRYFRGIAIDTYNGIIRKAATDAGCYVVDLASFGYDYDALDGTHPTALGMKQMAALYIKGMEAADPSQPKKPYLEGLFDETMRSAEFCQKPCVGCEFARATGNAWYNVCEKQIASQ